MVEKFNILSVGGNSKGLNIFKSSAYKEHERAPMAQMFWIFRWNAVTWILCAVAFALAFVLEHIFRYGWSPATSHWASLFFHDVIRTGGISVVAQVPSWIVRSLIRPDFWCIMPLLPIIAFYLIADDTLTKEFNPHGKDIYDSKSSRKATAEDIKQMGQNYKNKEGLFNGFMMVLGYFKDKGTLKPLRLDECLSVLCVAPPGSGKSVALVLPTILECDNVSMIIYDPKPELDGRSSGYRATIGPVFIINWGGQDDPENGIFYPSWNPLSPENIPASTEKRDTYISAICKILIPDARGSADPHWSDKGRGALIGMIHYLVSKVERAKADDYFVERLQSGTFDQEDANVLMEYYLPMYSNPNAFAAMGLLQRGELNAMNYVHIGTWAHIPDEWKHKEASLSMLLDWLTAMQLANSAEMEERRKQGDQMSVALADPMKDVLEKAVNEATEFAYTPRAISELTDLANTPDRERGSVLSTVTTDLEIFRNAAVRNRTSHSDFHFEDLRGMLDPRDGKIKPVSVYLSINQVDALAFNPITAIFIELMSNYLLENKPDVISTNGKKLGPYPVLFSLDEFPTIPKLDAVIRGPALGRGQLISYLMIGQDLSQIAATYGKEAVETLQSTTAAKVIMRQNNMETAKYFSEMIGNEIKKKIKKKKDKDGNETGETEEETEAPKPLYSQTDIMTLDPFKQIILYQGWYHRPIEAEQERYYLEKSETQKRLNAKVEMGRSSPLPEFLVPAHCKAMGYKGPVRFLDPVTKTVKILAE